MGCGLPLLLETTMNDIIETLIIDGYAVEIYHDPDVEHPRAWCSSTLCTAHRRYDFGGESLSGDAASIEEAFAEHLADRGLTKRDVIHPLRIQGGADQPQAGRHHPGPSAK